LLIKAISVSGRYLGHVNYWSEFKYTLCPGKKRTFVLIF